MLDFFEGVLLWETRAVNVDQLHDPAVEKLIHHDFAGELALDSLLVGLDASHEVRLRLVELRHKLRQGLSEARADGVRFLLSSARGCSAVQLRGELVSDVAQHRHSGVLQILYRFSGKLVVVLGHEPLAIVVHLACEVPDNELTAAELVLHKHASICVCLDNFAYKCHVRRLGDLQLLVKYAKDTRLFRLLGGVAVDHVDDRLVVLEAEIAGVHIQALMPVVL
mmetsp:Transcript_48386/g.134860  ORF Transcript_48386/g.134860 Transcript_48386/m.134860 type:complete len:223 (-) Transcript_48386:1506-2174(-)